MGISRFIKGMLGEAADKRGAIEVSDLYKYVYHSTLKYIDRVNQERTLINQQKRSRGETDSLYEKYPQQEPKLIVEAIGEFILGTTPTQTIDTFPRNALIVEGYGREETLFNLTTVLNEKGKFVVQYWNGQDSLKELLQKYLCKTSSLFFLYLRGKIKNREDGESVLILDEDIQITRSWLKEQFKNHQLAQQIVVLDCSEANNLKDWLEDWKNESQCSQCLIAVSSPQEDREQFAKILLNTLETIPLGLSAAK